MNRKASSWLARTAVLGMVAAGCGQNNAYPESVSNIGNTDNQDAIVTAASFDASVNLIEISAVASGEVATDESTTLETNLISAYPKNKLGENLVLVSEEPTTLFCNVNSDCPGKTVCDAGGCVQYNQATSITDKVCSGFLEEVLDTGEPMSLSESSFLPIGNNLTINDYFCTIKPLNSGASILENVVKGSCFGMSGISLITQLSKVFAAVCWAYEAMQYLGDSLADEQAEKLISTFKESGVNVDKSEMLLCSVDYTLKVTSIDKFPYSASCVYPAKMILENKTPAILSINQLPPIVTTKSYAQDFSIKVLDSENEDGSEKLACVWSSFDKYTYNALQNGETVMLPSPTSLGCDETYNFFTSIEGQFYVEVKFVDQGSKQFTFLEEDSIYHQTPEISWDISEQKSGSFMPNKINAYFEEVPSLCTSHASKICLDNAVYWNNSCGNLEEKVKDCTNDQYCENGKCKYDVVVCLNKCDYVGETMCFDNNHFVECVSDDYGCLEWSYNNCGLDEICVSGECQTEIPECTVEGTLCIGNTIYQEDSCGGLTKVKACLDSQVCEEGQCQDYAAACVNECAYAGEKTCSGNVDIAECVKDDNGCLKLIYSGCGDNEICQDKECIPTPETGKKCVSWTEYQENGIIKSCKKDFICIDDGKCVNDHCKPCQCSNGCPTTNEYMCYSDNSSNGDGFWHQYCDGDLKCPSNSTCVNEKLCIVNNYKCIGNEIWNFEECGGIFKIMVCQPESYCFEAASGAKCKLTL